MENLTQKYQTIKDFTEKEDYSNAIKLVDELIKENNKDDMAYYLKGNIFKKQNNWQEAINNYTLAIEINPENPATTMRRICIDILNFFNKDMFNH
ncbi:MAG: tetratricopeptide repeat protein [Bacteroidales bacterium]|jgi:tetratricopeptide (TPR) repeat protein|nr:tetratricopeptide repeat protein [Bacteroidales bacterium]